MGIDTHTNSVYRDIVSQAPHPRFYSADVLISKIVKTLWKFILLMVIFSLSFLGVKCAKYKSSRVEMPTGSYCLCQVAKKPWGVELSRKPPASELCWSRVRREALASSAGLALLWSHCSSLPAIFYTFKELSL